MYQPTFLIRSKSVAHCMHVYECTSAVLLLLLVNRIASVHMHSVADDRMDLMNSLKY